MEVQCLGVEGVGYPVVPYHATYTMILLMLPTYPSSGQRHTCEIITLPQLLLRAVISSF